MAPSLYADGSPSAGKTEMARDEILKELDSVNRQIKEGWDEGRFPPLRLIAKKVSLLLALREDELQRLDEAVMEGSSWKRSKETWPWRR